MKEQENYTDEQSIKMKLEKQIRLLGYVAASVIISTNFINIWVNRVTQLEEQQIYQEEANRRRLEHAVEKLKYELKVEELTVALEECNKY